MIRNRITRVGESVVEPYPGPQAGPQSQFLSADDVDIVIYGGAAGGGKTFGLLLDAVKHTKVKGFGAVIFRRTSKQIRNEGGLWDEALKLYAGHAEPKSTLLTWLFPNGTKISFAAARMLVALCRAVI